MGDIIDEISPESNGSPSAGLAVQSRAALGPERDLQIRLSRPTCLAEGVNLCSTATHPTNYTNASPRQHCDLIRTRSALPPLLPSHVKVDLNSQMRCI